MQDGSSGAKRIVVPELRLDALLSDNDQTPHAAEVAADSSEHGGVGLIFHRHSSTPYLVVKTVVPHGPACSSKLIISGDWLCCIDGVELVNNEQWQWPKLAGNHGSRIALTFSRLVSDQGHRHCFTLTLVRSMHFYPDQLSSTGLSPRQDDEASNAEATGDRPLDMTTAVPASLPPADAECETLQHKLDEALQQKEAAEAAAKDGATALQSALDCLEKESFRRKGLEEECARLAEENALVCDQYSLAVSAAARSNPNNSELEVSSASLAQKVQELKLRLDQQAGEMAQMRSENKGLTAEVQSLRREKATLIDALTAKGRLITASTLSHAFGVAGVGGVNPHGVLSGGGVTGGMEEPSSGGARTPSRRAEHVLTLDALRHAHMRTPPLTHADTPPQMLYAASSKVSAHRQTCLTSTNSRAPVPRTKYLQLREQTALSHNNLCTAGGDAQEAWRMPTASTK